MDKRLLSYYIQHILSAGTAFVRGRVGETLVQHILESQGYQAVKPAGRCEGDLLVTDLTTGERLKVEVKTARANVRGKYQFCLKKSDKFGGTDCGHSDVVVLVAITKAGSCSLFVLPASECPGRQITISGNPHQYRGKYSGFRQYHHTLNLRTDVHNFSDRFANSRNSVYAG